MIEEDAHPAFVCPLTQQIFKDPVIADDGHTYEKEQILKWIQRNKTSPNTRQKISTNLRPNIVIKQMIDSFYECQAKYEKLDNTNKQFKNKFDNELNKIGIKIGEQQKFKNDINVDAYSCPLTKKIFQQPVIASDNHTYEKKAIQEWLKTNEKSPKTGQKLSSKKLIPNHTTKAMIDLLKQQKKKVWQKLQENQKKFIFFFGPKINKLLNQQISQYQSKKAQNLLGNWSQKNMEIQMQQPEQIIKKQADLSAYKLKIDKKKFQIPTLCDFYVERQAYLSLISQRFCESSVVCITGFAGVGKSQIAIQYINKQSKYDTVIWLNGGHNLYIFQIKKYLEAAFKFPQQKFKTQEQLLRQFFRIVGEKGIIVIDNFQQKQIDSLFLQEFKGKILFTTRYKEWKFSTIQIQQFSGNQAHRYLAESLKDTQVNINQENAKILSDLVCGIPLALSQTVAYLKQHPNIDEYINIFKKTSGQLLKQAHDQNSKNIYTSLILALHKIRKQNNQIDELLNAIGYFSNEHIELNSTTQFFLFLDPKLSLKKIKKMRRALKSLRNYSLLVSGEQQHKYKINNITQSLIRFIHKRTDSYTKNIENIIQWLTSIIQQIQGVKQQLLIQSKVNLFKGSTPQPDINHNNEHILKLFSHIAHIVDISDIDVAENKLHFNKILYSLSKLYQYFHAKGYYIYKRFCITTMHNIAKNKLGQQNLQTKYLKICQGEAQNITGDSQKALNTLKQVLKPNNKKQQFPKYLQAKTLLNLGNTYFKKGTYEKALECQTKALQIYNNYYPNCQKQKYQIKNFLSFTYSQMGDYKKSINIMLEVLEFYEQQYGNNHHYIAPRLSNLANMYLQIKDFKNQRKCLQRALKIQELYYKEDNLDITRTLTGLATAQGIEGNMQKRNRLLQRAIAFHNKFFGPQHIETVQLKVNLANGLKNFSQKKQQIQRLAPIIIKYYGENHQKVSLIYYNLANAQLGMDNIVQAQKLYIKTLKIARQSKLPAENKIIQSCNFLLQLIKKIKNKQQNPSQLHLKKILILNPDLKYIYKAQIDSCLKKQKLAIKFIQKNENIQKAIQILQDCQNIYAKYFGKECQQLIDGYNYLATAYANIKDYSQAKQMILKCINLYIQHKGENGYDLGLLYDKLAQYNRNLGNIKESQQISLEAIHSRAQNLKEILHKLSQKQRNQFIQKQISKLLDDDEGHQQVNKSNQMQLLAEKYLRQGVKFEEAANLFQKSILIVQKYYGKDHQSLRITLSNLAVAYGVQKKWDKAIQVLKRLISLHEKYSQPYCQELVQSWTVLSQAYTHVGDAKSSQYAAQKVYEIIQMKQITKIKKQKKKKR